MNIAVDGNNFFNTGWLTRFVGLPKEAPYLAGLKDSDKEAFEDGWDMCDDTSEPGRIQAYYRLVRLGQISVCWVDDDNNEV